MAVYKAETSRRFSVLYEQLTNISFCLLFFGVLPEDGGNH
jgi:hypothetical protein